GLPDSPIGQLAWINDPLMGFGRYAPPEPRDRDGNPTPTGVAVLPYNFQSVRAIAERSNNIVHWSALERGGHFAALDAPDLLVGDLRAFFRRFR
ncbi:MAG TPA: epoxide hydrolase, partial [Glycomyces sp.]|nr:epoxide hydrolase [Glycomyces sp.]